MSLDEVFMVAENGDEEERCDYGEGGGEKNVNRM